MKNIFHLVYKSLGVVVILLMVSCGSGLTSPSSTSDSGEILSFVITSADNLAAGVEADLPLVIDEGAKTATATVTNVDVASLIPTLSNTGKSISPASGAAQNFSTNLIYTVTSESGASASYTVTLTPYYSVVFDANGGSYSGAAPTNYVVYGFYAPVLSGADSPTLVNKSLAGWSLTPGGEAYGFNTPITNATTLYALWIDPPQNYTVSFNTAGGVSNVVVSEGSPVPSGSVPIPSCIPTWYLDTGYSQVFSLGTAITNNLTLYGSSSEALGRLTATGKLPTSIDEITSSDPVDQARWRSILAPYFPASAGKPLVFRYAAETTVGSNTGNDWANAWSGDGLRLKLSGITSASVSNIYVVLVAGGTYKPTTGTDRSLSFSLKNYVAVVGGIKGDGFSSGCGGGVPTVFSGDIGVAGSDSDNTQILFNNNNIANTAVLSGATITGGKYSGVAGAAGMNNNFSSPTLTEVNFLSNSSSYVGGMRNNYSSPVLTRVTFSYNTSASGGGMANYGSLTSFSSPILTDVTFFSNTANNLGGGMYNQTGSNPILNNVTFFGNTAIGYYGGGMYNEGSNPILNHVTFFKNSASRGGGMYNNNNGQVGPRLVNTLFWSNTADMGSQIYMDNSGAGAENLQIYYSLVQGGLTGGLTSTGGIGGGFGSANSGAAINIYPHTGAASAILSGDPLLGGLSDHGGSVQTVAIGSGAARNAGAYIKQGSDGTFYYRTDTSSNWFSFINIGAKSFTTTLPSGVVDVNAADARGYTRTDRPDLGAYEYGATPTPTQ